MDIRDNFSESLETETLFRVTNTKIIRNLFGPGSEIRKGKNLDPGSDTVSGINIPDPQQ